MMDNLSLLITIVAVEEQPEKLRKINDGLKDVQDFYHDKVDVDVKYELYPIPDIKDARIDFYEHSRSFPAIYLLSCRPDIYRLAGLRSYEGVR
jgi:hypothetical protein